MPPPRDVSAEEHALAAKTPPAVSPSPEDLAEAIRGFLATHSDGAALEDGKVVLELSKAQYSVKADHGRCTLQLWSSERNLVRTVVSLESRPGTLRLRTQRFGYAQPKLLELRATAPPRSATRREPARQQYLRLLERVLAREFPEWRPEAFRAAMDLERSFGPAYARGSLVRGKEAWAVIGVSGAESQAIVDGVLSLGILWLHQCREQGDGRWLYKGLKVVVPRGQGTLTLARLPWMNSSAAQWELYELHEPTEELVERDPADQGNLRTRLVHLPDESAARERFAHAVAQVMRLVPPGQEHRVEQRLRSTAELGFLLHGLEFARARISLAPSSFTHTLEITVGSGASHTVLRPANQDEIALHIADLFARRDAHAVPNGRRLRSAPPPRSIGAFTGKSAHARVAGFAGNDPGREPLARLELRERALATQSDPLFRAVPERWLESVLRENLAPLTRSLAPTPRTPVSGPIDRFANDPDPDTRGNRLESARDAQPTPTPVSSRGIIPRLDPRYVYNQVPAIAGATDRGMLDLLGVTADGRLAVMELKAADDLQMALQGLDYWIRVRHHHTQSVHPATGLPGAGSDLQRHGYFRDVELSPLPPRLYLVAPALHIHPATETILRYLSPRVEWTLLALDERWRQEVRVVWRKTGGGTTV